MNILVRTNLIYNQHILSQNSVSTLRNTAQSEKKLNYMVQWTKLRFIVKKQTIIAQQTGGSNAGLYMFPRCISKPLSWLLKEQQSKKKKKKKKRATSNMDKPYLLYIVVVE